MYPCSIWGPTCDGLDRIVEQCDLPDLQVGDWLVFENMGAYTVAASSTFNGFQRPDIHYVMSRPAWWVDVTEVQSSSWLFPLCSIWRVLVKRSVLCSYDLTLSDLFSTGNTCSRSVPRACQLLRRSPACLKCQPAVVERAAWRCPLSPARPMWFKCIVYITAMF